MAAASLDIGGKVGEYEITGVLGKGGMGTVYSGIHPVIGKKVAVKVLNAEVADNQEIVTRFVQEARAVNQIGHNNIIDIFAFGELDGGGHYFVMEHLPGRSARDLLEEDGPLSLQALCPIIDQIAAAIDAAHAVGIYHRDLKPDNIYLVPQGSGPPVVKVLDFGIAKLSENASVAKTSTGVPMGTPTFMSPEQWRGQEVDHLTDIYALGVMVHNLVTGQLPFQGKSFPELMYKHLNEQPELPSSFGAPVAIDAVVNMALEKDKALRFSSAHALAKALSDAAQELPMRSRRASCSPPVKSPTGTIVASDSGAGRQSTPAEPYAVVADSVVADAGPRRGLVYGGGVVILLGGAAALVLALGGDGKKETGTVAQEARSQTDARPMLSPSDGGAKLRVSPVQTTAPANLMKGSIVIIRPITGTLATLDGDSVNLGGRQTKIEDMPVGRHVVTASAEGYETGEFEFTIEAGESQVVSLKLTKLSKNKKLRKRARDAKRKVEPTSQKQAGRKKAESTTDRKTAPRVKPEGKDAIKF